MAIIVPRYRVDDFDMYPFVGTVDSETYYGYDTTFRSSAAFVQQETSAVTVHLYRDESTDIMSLHIIIDAYENDNSGSGLNINVTGLPSSSSITVQDDPNDTYNRPSPDTIDATFSWGTCCTDGMVIDGLQDFSQIEITANAINGVDKFKLVASNGEVIYQNFNDDNVVVLTQTTEELDSYLYLEPQPSVYSSAKQISATVSDDVAEVLYTTDGTSPSLAKYLAYDNKTPPNPFIAVVEDGKGNVLFDGGFPKWYNARWDSSASVFSDLDARFKYLCNALEYIANPDKISQGNKNILIVGDTDKGSNYSVAGTEGTSFKTTFAGACNIMGFTPTFKTKSDYGGQLDMDYSELNQYCALIVMSSTSTSARLITEGCVNDILISREQGNGILMVTDHGASVPSLDAAKNSTYSGFFRTANYIATNLGAYFTGDVNRVPVNVGFLRSEYGTHPLWNNISDSEDIYAGGSESSVVVPATSPFPPTSIPPINLSTDGYHTYRYLMRLNDGSIVTESYTYGLNVSELVEVYDSGGVPVSKLGPTNYRQIEYDFNVIPGSLGSLSGLIKRNNSVVGEFTHDGNEFNVVHYSYDGLTPYVNTGDTIVIQITDPLEYVKTIPVLRNQRDIFDTLSMGKRIRYINRNEWGTYINDKKLLKNSLSSINRVYGMSVSNNMSKMHNYMTDQERIPEVTALIYDTEQEFDDAILSTVPPTPAQVFSQWGVFSTTGQTFYENINLAPDTTPYNTWTYDESNDRVVQTANVNSYTGFVSSLPIENYIHEATLTSSSGDDDLIGLVIAHKWDGVKNHTLSAIVSMGGINPMKKNVLSIIVNHQDTDDVIAQRSHDEVHPTGSSDPGWAGRKMRVKVERDGNIVKVMASKWDDVKNYSPESEIIIDLNSSNILQEFLGPQNYGYSTRSQANSTYLDIKFTGGLNYNIISNASDGITSVYNNGLWKPIGSPMQVVYDYPRIVTNPSTNLSYIVLENDTQSYWGDVDEVEVCGTRRVNSSNNDFQILNYDSSKVYTITTDHGNISTYYPNFTLDNIGNYTGQITVTVSDGTSILDIILEKS